MTTSMNQLAQEIASWRERKGFETSWLNVPEKLMLIVTELAEAMEAYRHIIFSGTLGTPVPSEWVDNFREELADTLIRTLDLTASLDINIEDEVITKMKVNERRQWKHGKER